ISAAKDADGAVLHLAKPAKLTFGERDDVGLSARVLAFAAACVQGGVDHLASEDIRQEQWIKYTFLTALAAATCLRRADIGTIMDSEGGEDFLRALYA